MNNTATVATPVLENPANASLTVMIRTAMSDVIESSSTNDGGNHGTSSSSSVTAHEPIENHAFQPKATRARTHTNTLIDQRVSRRIW